MNSLKKTATFLRAYIKSMRLYYSFITGIAGLIGMTYYQYFVYNSDKYSFTHPYQPATLPKLLVIMVILFLSWGINQIFNDYLGMDEDRINAPERPMVSGELHPLTAVTLSALLMFAALIFTWFYLEPPAVIPLVAGVALNLVYEYAKGHGLWGNLIFGIMISMCAVYSFMAAGPTDISMLTWGSLLMVFYISLINGLMTFYTYFKDYEGDKATGKNTLVVKMGIERARRFALLASFSPAVCFMIIYFGFEVWEYPLNSVVIMIGVLSTGLQLWTGYLYFHDPSGSKTYFSLSVNFRACACTESAIIAIFNPALGVILFLMSFFFIGFLFNFHVNVKG